MENTHVTTQDIKEIFSAKVVSFDIQNGNGHIVMLNTEQASQYGIKDDDKISLIRKNEEFVVDVTLTDSYVQANEIGVTKDFLAEYPIMEGDTVLVSFVKNNPLSMQAIRKKLLGKKITEEEIDAIIEDIKNNKIQDLVLAYYVSTSFFYKSDIHELAYTTKATAYTGDMYRFPGTVAGKYCIGGVPGNETTMVIVPILASLGITVPKSFSKAITSPAATGECVNVEIISEEFECEGTCTFGIIISENGDLELNNIKFGLGGAMVAAFHEIGAEWNLTMDALGILGKGLFSFNKGEMKDALNNLSGPVGAVKIGGLFYEMGGWGAYFAFAAIISLALAIFNVLPIPALDGGRAVGMILQSIFKIQPEKYFKYEGYVNMFFFYLILLLGVIIIIKDLIVFWGVNVPFVS